MTRLLLGLAFVVSVACSHGDKQGDRMLRSHEIPSFLQKYNSSSYKDADFFEKLENDQHVYEVKYLENKKEVSLKFSKNGQFLEEEKDIDLDDLDEAVKRKITSFIDEHYKDASIHEVELRKDESQRSFIDVEIRHKTSPTKYWELSFDSSGAYVSKKIEHYDDIQTLN